MQGAGFAIDRIALTLQATVPGLDETRFQALALTAKQDCPLSKALTALSELSSSDVAAACKALRRLFVLQKDKRGEQIVARFCERLP